jgi:tRNA (guanine-N7-)-methyltransferase
MSLAELLPDSLLLALEIRAKVCEFVRLRIEATRLERPGQLQNAACLRTNCMRYLPNFLPRGQLDKIFICFPDPHFKAKNHRRRIVSETMLSEYAYFLRPGGFLYTVTDVEDLHNWHVTKCGAHRSFLRVDDKALEHDACVRAMLEDTEEGKKVARNQGRKFFAVYRRLEEHELAPPPLLALLDSQTA